jgi:hypothetical protein
MSEISWIERLMQRWQLGSSLQVIIVLIVFACTGFTVYFLKQPVLFFISGGEAPTTAGTILYYLLILPVYNVLLLGYGFVLGQFNFFWKFEKRFFRRIISTFKKQN